MSSPFSRSAWVLLAAGLFVCGPAQPGAAQPAVDSFTRLPEVLHVGSVVYVEDAAGHRIKGTVGRLSAASLAIVTPGVVRQELSFSADHVVRVTKVDSRLDGFLIGAAAGAVPGVRLGYGINQYCYNESPDHCPRAIVLVGGLLAAVGGAIGWKIDDTIDGETVVFAKRVRASSRIRLSPGMTRRGAGLVLSVVF